MSDNTTTPSLHHHDSQLQSILVQSILIQIISCFFPAMESVVTDNEYTLSLAMEDTKVMRFRASARRNAVKVLTLRDRINGATNIRAAHEKDQSLTVVV